MSNEQDFKVELISKVLNEKIANGGFSNEIFFDKATDLLLENDVLEDEAVLATWIEKGVHVDGYYYNIIPSEEKGFNVIDEVDLFVIDFDDDTNSGALTQTQFVSICNKAFKYVEKSFKNQYFKTTNMDDSFPIYELTYELWNHRENINKINLYVLSNRRRSKQLKEIETKKLFGKSVNVNLWDLDRLYQLSESGVASKDYTIDLNEYSRKSIYCLAATKSELYSSYLFVLPGIVLAGMYERYGSKLLEQNVRTYLQTKGKVNKKIRDTLIEDPDRFFSYNNGISGVADSIEYDTIDGVTRIKSLTNFQIVNGGQTTASIYHVFRKYNSDLDNVFVQVKLTIVQKEMNSELVPLISRYANTQNAVKNSDFASNHPLHIKLEALSRKTMTANNGKWFFERARGQYADRQAYFKNSEKRTFLVEYPKTQKFVMEDVGKYLLLWDEYPYIVAKGRQKSFSYFSEMIEKNWNDNSESSINDLFYKELVAKIIVFNSTTKIIAKSSYYLEKKAFRSQTIAYTIALISHLLKKEKLSLRFVDKIWKDQCLSDNLSDFIESIGSLVFNHLFDAPPTISNISEYAKRELCWTNLKSKIATINISLEDIMPDLVSTDVIKESKSNAKSEERFSNEMETMVFFQQLTAPQIDSLVEKGEDYGFITTKERGILQKAKSENFNLSNAQSKMLLKFSHKFDDAIGSLKHYLSLK